MSSRNDAPRVRSSSRHRAPPDVKVGELEVTLPLHTLHPPGHGPNPGPVPDKPSGRSMPLTSPLPLTPAVISSQRTYRERELINKGEFLASSHHDDSAPMSQRPSRPVSRDVSRSRRSPTAPSCVVDETSPQIQLDKDRILVAQLRQRGAMSRSLLDHISQFLDDRGKELARAHASTVDVVMTEQMPPTTTRRQRSSDETLDLVTPKCTNKCLS